MTRFGLVFPATRVAIIIKYSIASSTLNPCGTTLQNVSIFTSWAHISLCTPGFLLVLPIYNRLPKTSGAVPGGAIRLSCGIVDIECLTKLSWLVIGTQVGHIVSYIIRGQNLVTMLALISLSTMVLWASMLAQSIVTNAIVS